MKIISFLIFSAIWTNSAFAELTASDPNGGASSYTEFSETSQNPEIVISDDSNEPSEIVLAALYGWERLGPRKGWSENQNAYIGCRQGGLVFGGEEPKLRSAEQCRKLIGFPLKL